MTSNLKKYKIQDESLDEEDEIKFVAKNSNSPLRKTKISPIKNNQKMNEFNDDNIVDASLSQSVLKDKERTNARASVNKAHDLNNISNIDIHNMSDDTLNPNVSTTKILKKEEGNYHHVQIVDEDVENYKRKLDIALKNFRTDSLKDFLAIKRHLLAEQKQIIESEKQKCDAIVSAKLNQVEMLKESLAKTSSALNKELETKEKLTLYILKLKSQINNRKIKDKVYTNGIRADFKRNKKTKRISAKIKRNYLKRLKKNAFFGLKENFKDMQVVKALNGKDADCQRKTIEISQVYGREISDLRNKLVEANNQLEKLKESKNAISENLRKALMRGVVAMNMEAMNVLEDDTQTLNLNFNALDNITGTSNPNFTQIINQNSSNQMNQNPNNNYVTVNNIKQGQGMSTTNHQNMHNNINNINNNLNDPFNNFTEVSTVSNNQGSRYEIIPNTSLNSVFVEKAEGKVQGKDNNWVSAWPNANKGAVLGKEEQEQEIYRNDDQRLSKNRFNPNPTAVPNHTLTNRKSEVIRQGKVDDDDFYSVSSSNIGNFQQQNNYYDVLNTSKNNILVNRP
jgi:hypothetical protein